MFIESTHVVFNIFEIIVHYIFRQVFVLLSEGQVKQEPPPLLTRSIQNGSEPMV